GHEQRDVTDVLEARTLSGAAAFKRSRKTEGERDFFGDVGGGRALEETGQKLDDIKRRELLRRQTLMRQGPIDQFFEILDRRFAPEHSLPHSHHPVSLAVT